jgi:steroid 5-alpha reductase family enzyme
VELVTSGPYRYTRNPLYLGRLLIFTGLCLMANPPLAVTLLLLGAGYSIFFGYYLPRKERVEGDRLRQRHGEAFDRYRRAVPALFPSARPYAGYSQAGWSTERMLANREHWMVAGLFVISVFLLLRATLWR